jgi:hypothetical protein
MTPEDREKFERWAKRLEEIDAGLAANPIGIVPHLAKQFPIPDTSGMTTEQTEAVLAKWRAEVNAAIAKLDAPQTTPSSIPTHAQTPTKPGTPVA